jgi:hypothetical protein
MLGKFTMEPVGPFASTLICAGIPVNVGPVVSCTVMMNVFAGVVELPWLSVAWQVTVLLPRGKVEPEAGVQLEVETASSGSVALNEYVTEAPAAP